MYISYRGLTNDQLEELEARFDKTCTPADLKQYMHEAFELTEEEAHHLINKHAELITDMMNEEALVYIVADVILNIELMEGKARVAT